MNKIDVYTYLDSLNINTKYIDLSYYNLEMLPDLSKFRQLKYFNCQYNKLTNIDSLKNNPNLETIWCNNNLLTYIYNFDNLKVLDCSYNQITKFPNFKNIESIRCYNNPIHNLYSNIFNTYLGNFIFNDTNRKKLQILNNFKENYFYSKFKNNFRNILWEKIRKPKIEKFYHPDNLAKFLEEHGIDFLEEYNEDSLEFLDYW